MIYKSVPDCYKNQEICNKEVDNYPPMLEFVSKYYKTQKMCAKVVDIHFLQQHLFLNVIRLKKCVMKELTYVFFCIWFYS